MAAQNNPRSNKDTVNSSRKRKAGDETTTEPSDTRATLDLLEEAIVKAAAPPLVLDDTNKASKRVIRPTFDDSVPCQGCGQVGLKIWRKGPNGIATLCNPCGDKFAKGTLGPLIAPDARPSFGRAKVSKTPVATDVPPAATAATLLQEKTQDNALPKATPQVTQAQAVTARSAPMPPSLQPVHPAKIASGTFTANKDWAATTTSAAGRDSPASTNNMATASSVVPAAVNQGQRPMEKLSTGPSRVPSSTPSTLTPNAHSRPDPAVPTSLMDPVSQQRPYPAAAPESTDRPESATQPYRPGAGPGVMSYLPYARPPAYSAAMPGQAWANGGSPYPFHPYPGPAFSALPISPQMAQYHSATCPPTARPMPTSSSSVRSTQTDAPSHLTQTDPLRLHYHAPDSAQAYIPPRPIVPSTIRNPLMETASKVAQSEGPHPPSAVPYRTQEAHAYSNGQNTPRDLDSATRAVSGQNVQQMRHDSSPASVPAPPI